MGRAQLLSPAILEYLSTGQKLFNLGPIYLLLHAELSISQEVQLV